MQLFSHEFAHVQNTEPLVPVTVLVPWPAGAPNAIGLLGTQFLVNITRNDDPDLTIFRTALVRRSDSQIIDTTYLLKGTPGWDGVTTSFGILGATNKIASVLPVTTAVAIPHWHVDKVPGLALILDPRTPVGPARPFRAQIEIVYIYTPLNDFNQPLTDDRALQGTFAASANEAWVISNQGKIFYTVNATVPNPTWVAIKPPPA
jgi:hypothetical protein